MDQSHMAADAPEIVFSFEMAAFGSRALKPVYLIYSTGGGGNLCIMGSIHK